MGLVSKLPYKDWFARYKEILIQRWTSRRIEHALKMMNHYVFGAPDSQSSSDGLMGSLDVALDTALAQLDLGFDDDSDANDLYSARLPAATAGLEDESGNGQDHSSFGPAVVQPPSATSLDQPVDDPLSVLTVETGSSTSRAKKGRSKKGKTRDHPEGIVGMRRSTRTQGEK